MKLTPAMRNRLIVPISAAMALALAMPCFAQSAPVFDADTMQQVAMDNGDQGQDLPMPPPPGQEGAFVPMQAQAQAQESPNISPQSPGPQSPAFAAPSQPIASGGDDQQRLKRLEQQLSNIQNSSSSSRIEALQKEIQSLRGQVEQQNHELDQLRHQQKSMYTDLDKRLAMDNSKPLPEINSDNTATETVMPVLTQKPVKSAAKPKELKSVETKETSMKLTDAKRQTKTIAAASTNAAKNSLSNQPNVAEEQQIYQKAYNLIKAKKYEEAVQALQKMLVKYPSGQFASNAHYWLGELYGLMGKHDQALTEFSTVVKNYPESPRIADAQLKIGLIYATKFNWSEAKSNFKKVVNQYPGTASARLALEQLREIKQAGH